MIKEYEEQVISKELKNLIRLRRNLRNAKKSLEERKKTMDPYMLALNVQHCNEQLKFELNKFKPKLVIDNT